VTFAHLLHSSLCNAEFTMTSYAVHRISTLTTPRHLIVELGGNGGSSAGFSRSTSTAVHDDRISEVIILLLLCFIKETCFCS